MKPARVKEILEKIKSVKIAVYGDFCLDAYWILSPKGGEISVETGLQSQGIKRHYYTLGGASNIVANLSALGPAHIRCIGTIGEDIFGREIKSQLKTLGVDTNAIITQKENFDTVTFAKRYLNNTEQPRIDFGFFNKRSKETDDSLINNIRAALKECDVLIFNQQVPGSITNHEFIHQANDLFDEFNDSIVLLDSRHYSDKFSNVYRKTNDLEAAVMNGMDAVAGDIITLEKAKQFALQLYNDSKKPVFLTRGPRGLLVVDAGRIHEIHGIHILKKTDTVGAGDTTIGAIALCLGANLAPAEAAEFANLAACVTIQKLFQTGTAWPEEIIEVSKDADYIYQPEIAEDIRRADCLNGTEIELCCPKNQIATARIKYAIFDHDGTISTLRQGWEQVMEMVMIKAIMGSKYETADEALYHKVVARVSDYINKSTGIQTILQMEALVEMVREFDLVSEGKIADKFACKKIYNDALMETVNKRIEKLYKGELDISDYTIKGAVDFLTVLKEKGIVLYLASGTDYEDVVNEAKALGYAQLFDGGIYGSVGDVSKYSKKMVIEKIIAENNLNGPELAVFGDGPVEIKECRKCDGIAVGVASDEIRRYGLNKEKRSRLIKAGANIIVPDFSEFKELLKFLFES